MAPSSDRVARTALAGGTFYAPCLKHHENNLTKPFWTENSFYKNSQGIRIYINMNWQLEIHTIFKPFFKSLQNLGETLNLQQNVVKNESNLNADYISHGYHYYWLNSLPFGLQTELETDFDNFLGNVLSYKQRHNSRNKRRKIVSFK